MAKLSAPSGFRDFLPDQFRKRAELMRRIREVYESFGFEGMDTPAMENLGVFLGKGGGENEKLMFHVLKRGADLQRSLEKGGGELSDMALRFDLTVPLARYYNTHRAELPAVFKRYQIGPVWRAERAQHGRFREFIQCDVDVLGSASMQVEAEVILATSTALARLGFTGLTVRLNSRPLLQNIVRWVGVQPDRAGEVISWIDKLDKPDSDWRGTSLVNKEIPADVVDKLVAIYTPRYSTDFSSSDDGEVQTKEDLFSQRREYLSRTPNEERLGKLEKQLGPDSKLQIDNLRQILNLIPSLPSGRIIFDDSLARGMDYYTGPIFEIASEGVPFSLAGGGRFDGLVDKIASGKDPAPLPDGRPGGVPACGFSIGFERVFTLMEERGMFGASSRAADVLIAVPAPEAAAEAAKLGAELRASGVRADVYPGAGKPVPQYELAQKKGIPYAIMAEPAKLASGMLEVRDLATRQNTPVPRAELAAWLKGREGGA